MKIDCFKRDILFYRNTVNIVVKCIELFDWYFFLVDCEYSYWSEWEECSKTCGGGNQTRTRQVIREAWYGGTKCSEEDKLESASCNQEPCQGNIYWYQSFSFKFNITNDTKVNRKLYLYQYGMIFCSWRKLDRVDNVGRM